MAQWDGGGGRHRGGGRRQKAAPASAPTGPALKPDPWPRLDAGALLCRTEDGLRQHQAAVTAQLDGRRAPPVQGCRMVQAMTPVTVMEAHGPASTQVRLPGEAGQIGWTDAALPAGRPKRP